MSSEELATQFGQFSYSNQTIEAVGHYEPNALKEIEKHGRLYIIADGVLGTAAGAIASQYAIQKILHDFYRKTNYTDPEQHLLEVIQQVNADIFKQNRNQPYRRKIGTALMVALIHQNKLVLANVGDNRAYVVWEQSIELLNQKPPALPASVDRPYLPPALGLNETAEIETYYRRLFPGDTVLLCSGGFTGYVTEKQIAHAVASEDPPEAGQTLVELAQDNGNRDNLAISITNLLSQPVNQAPPSRSQLPPPPKWEELARQTTPKVVAPAPNGEPEPHPTPELDWQRWGGIAAMVGVALLLCVGLGGFAGWQLLASQIESPTAETTTAGVNQADTAADNTAAPTVAVFSTEAITDSTPTAEPTAITTVDNTSLVFDPTTTPVSTLTPTPSPTPLPVVQLPVGCTSGARFYSDVTIEDGTQISAGQTFEKVWRMQNNGTCPWVPGYTIRFTGGDEMHRTSEFLVPYVEPDVITQVTVPMVAPLEVGIYRSEWQFHDLGGDPFGAELYVEIEVVEPEPGTVILDPETEILYDFVANAEAATWSAAGERYEIEQTRIDEELVVPLPEGIVVFGQAELRGRQESSQPVLLTHPHEEVGLIEGVYELDTPLNPDDSLLVTVGFPQAAILNDDGVTFEVVFVPQDGAEQTIFSETVTYRQSPISRQLPLAGISVGETGSFILRARTGENSTYDWALWIEARLLRS